MYAIYIRYVRLLFRKYENQDDVLVILIIILIFAASWGAILRPKKRSALYPLLRNLVNSK